jgi:hypothetical protein
MNPMNPNKIMETWMNLVTEAMRGNGDARETVRTITGSSMRPDELLRLMTRFMPAGTVPFQAEALNEWLEEYWRMMGVVPRYRYLDLLERYEQLRLRLEETEKSRQLPMMSAAQPEEAQKVFGLWSSMMEETMKAQQEMLKAWTPNAAEGGSETGSEGSSGSAQSSKPKSGER